MEVNLKKWMDKAIENHQTITKLVEFYEEEMGSEMSYGSSSESGEEEQSEMSDEESSEEDGNIAKS